MKNMQIFIFLLINIVPLSLFTSDKAKWCPYVMINQDLNSIKNSDQAKIGAGILGGIIIGYAGVEIYKKVVKYYRIEKLKELTEKNIKKTFLKIITNAKSENDELFIQNNLSKMLKKIKSKIAEEFSHLNKKAIKQLKKDFLNEAVRPQFKRILVWSNLKTKAKLKLLNQFEYYLENSKHEFKVFN